MSRPNYVFPEETAAYTDSSAGRRNDAASRKSSQIPSVEDGATRDKTNNDGVDAVTTQMPKGAEHLMDQESSAEDDGQTDASVDETTIKSIKIKKMTTVKTIETKDEIESGTDVSSKQTLNDERKPKEKEKLMKSLKPENRSEKKLDDTPLVKVDGEVKVPKAIDGETKNRRQKSETNGEDNKHKISDDMRRIEHTRKEEDKKDRKDYSEEQDNKETEEDNMGSNEQFDENIRKQELMKGNATEDSEKTINENDEECEPDDILKYSIDITSSVKAIQSTTDKISSEEDDYYNFDITKEDNDDESEPVKEKANKVKKWKQINKKGRHEKIRKRKEKRLERKCRKYIEKKNELALQNVQNTGEKIDYQFSKEIMSKMDNGHVIDEVHASEDLEKMEPNEKKQAFDLNCASETDEFPQKCIAWQKAGFCESNQATQYLWCRKTCLCRWRNKRS